MPRNKSSVFLTELKLFECFPKSLFHKIVGLLNDCMKTINLHI